MNRNEQEKRAATFAGYAPKPVEQKKEHEPVSEGRLRKLIEADCVDLAQELITSTDAPYDIVDGKLIDKLKGTELWLKKFVTIDPETVDLKSNIMTLSKHQDEVLIHGETGTGKELLSRALIGNRSGKSLAINCAGLPENLVESELFGYIRGAFTGADGDRQGLMAAASDGLLFLDEIGELPLQAQAKLLRALQDKVVRRVGSNKDEPINCRFVFATNRNISDMVKAGAFRQDLYARISTFEFYVKPVRKRLCDISPICATYPRGQEFYEQHKEMLENGVLPLDHNVRSIQQHHRRWSVFGKVIIKR